MLVVRKLYRVVKVDLLVPKVELRDLVVVDEEFLNLVTGVINIMPFLGDLRYKPSML